jgi:hypothetical protein
MCFLAVLTAANRRLFAEPIYDDGDSALNSILIHQAKRFQLLTGSNSRMGFAHPGPGILYVLAASEVLFHGWLHLVPAPHNAYMLGALCLNATLLGFSLMILAAHWKSWVAVAVALAVFLGYFGYHGTLASHWLPHLYFAMYFTFAIAAGSVAAGGMRHLPLLGLAGSLAVHGHVCFVAFVLPIAAVAFVAVLARYRFQGRRLLAENRRSWIGLGIVVGIFVLPILLHSTFRYPGEIGKYLSYARSNQAGGNDAEGSVGFLLRCLTDDAAHPKRLALALLVAAGLSVFKRVSGAQVAVTRALIGVALLTTAISFYYVSRSVDDLQFTYVGIYYGSMFLLVLTIAAINAAVLASRNAFAAGVVVLASGFVGGYAVASGKFLNPYNGDPTIPTMIEALERQSPEGAAPILVTFDFRLWPVVAGVVVEMERRGKPVYLADEYWTFLFTKRFTQLPEDLLRRHPRRLDFTQPGMAFAPIVVQTATVAVQESDTHCRLGSEIVFDDHVRPFSRDGLTGGGPDGKWTTGSRAVLALDFDPIEQPVELTVVADAFVPEQHPRTTVNVIVNDQVVDHWTFQAGDGQAPRRTVLSPAIVNRQWPLQIVFETPDACSPAELGLSKDPRRLALCLHRLRLDELGAK